MQLAIGDVVRNHNDKTLGTVDGVASHTTGAFVALKLSGGITHLVSAQDLEVVARARKPMTTGRAVLTLLFLALGFVAAVVNGSSIQSLGGNWVLMVVASSGSLAIATSVLGLFLRPRRIRI